MKTSDFPTAETSAGSLSGSELVGVVQDETTVQTTSGYISNIVPQLPSVKSGQGAALYGFSSLAVGDNSSALGSTASMAIGGEGIAIGEIAMSIGAYTYVTGHYVTAIGKYNFSAGSPNNLVMLGASNEGSPDANYSTVIGPQTGASSPNQVAIGHDLGLDDGPSESSVFIGGGFATVSPYTSVGIGYHLGSYGPNCVAIGTKSKAIYRGVTVGYNAGFQDNEYASAGEATIAIGANLYTPVGPAISIGGDCLAVYNGIALGTGLADGKSVALGYSCNVGATQAVGIGQSLGAVGIGAVVLGSYNCNTYQHYAMLLGSATDPAIGGTFINAGVPLNALLRPVVFHQKLIGSTISPKPATAAWGDGSYLATVVYDTAGVIGNSLTLVVADNSPDSPLSTSFADDTFSILLATDDPSTNTLTNILGLFPVDGFSFGYTSGFDDTVISFIFSESFANGTDGAPTVVLTADGNSPSFGTNVPAIYESSLATVTGTVVGVTTELLNGGGGDAASFTLTPVMLLRNDETDYTFIGTPTFTLTSNTEDAGEWGAPTMTIIEDETQLQISVTNTDADVDWMAHLTFEASQNTASS